MKLYAEHTANWPRMDKDTFFQDPTLQVAYTGALDEAVRFAREYQLLDPVHWRRFVEQFRLHSDDADRGWRGEYWGKMMRGAAFVWSCTRDDALLAVLRETVEDMLSAADGDGRISTYTRGGEARGWDLWCRKYVLLGMQYFLEISRDEALNARILVSMCRQMDCVMGIIGPAEEGKTPITEASGNWRGLNSSSLLEPVTRLYSLTGDRRYLDFAAYIVSCGGTSVADVFQLAWEDVADPYQYPVTKAYELMSCFEGLLEYYRVTGIRKWGEAVRRFGRRLMATDVTVIGSCGCTHENLDHSAARQTDTAFDGIMQETCVTVTWMKLCRQLLLLTGESAYADAVERSFYNAYLGALNTEQITNQRIARELPGAIPEPLPYDSYSPLRPGIRGKGVGGLKLMPDGHYYGCCACIGAAGAGIAAQAAVLLTQDGAAVNFYFPGTAVTRTPEGARLTLVTETAYPADGSIRLSVTPERPERFALLLRVPAWSRRTVLSVNGEPVTAKPGYVRLERLWREGDTVELLLDLRIRRMEAPTDLRDVIFVDVDWLHDYLKPTVVVGSADAGHFFALERGPLVLARDARLGAGVDTPVEPLVREDGTVDARAGQAPFAAQLCLWIPTAQGGEFPVVDYASAGKTWDESSRCCCWIPRKV